MIFGLGSWGSSSRILTRFQRVKTEETAWLLAQYWIGSFSGFALGLFCSLLSPWLFLRFGLVCTTYVCIFVFLQGFYDLSDWTAGWGWGQIFALVLLGTLSAASCLLFPAWLKAQRITKWGIWDSFWAKGNSLALVAIWVALTASGISWRIFEVPYVADHEVEQLFPEPPKIEQEAQTLVRLDNFIKQLHRIERSTPGELPYCPPSKQEEMAEEVIATRQIELIKGSLFWLEKMEPKQLSDCLERDSQRNDQRAVFEAFYRFGKWAVLQEDTKTAQIALQYCLALEGKDYHRLIWASKVLGYIAGHIL